MTKPNLYLDVDGVILPFGKFSGTDFPFEMRKLNGLEYYAPTVVNRLGNTALSLVWCTTWESRALKELQDGMDALRNGRQIILPPVADRTTRISQKLEAIVADQSERPAPFVWIDDAITSEELDKVAECFRTTAHLVIRPEKAIGLNEDQLKAVEAFASEHQSV